MDEQEKIGTGAAKNGSDPIAEETPVPVANTASGGAENDTQDDADASYPPLTRDHIRGARCHPWGC